MKRCFLKKLLLLLLTGVLLLSPVAACDNDIFGVIGNRNNVTLSYWVHQNQTFIEAARRFVES